MKSGMSVMSVRVIASAALFSFCALNTFAQEAGKAEIKREFTDEVAAIKTHPKVQAAFDHVLAIEPQSRADLIELTEIPAPPFKEEARAKRFAEMLGRGRLDRCLD